MGTRNPLTFQNNDRQTVCFIRGNVWEVAQRVISIRWSWAGNVMHQVCPTCTTFITGKSWDTDRSKLNDGNGFPGQSPRRFGEPDREILHVFYECLRTPHPTGCICLFFVCLTFSRLRFLGNLNLIRPNDFGDKQKAGQVSGKYTKSACGKFQGLSLKNGVNIWTFVRENV